MRPPRNIIQSVLPANDCFSIHYNTFDDGSFFDRPANAWPNWTERAYTAPASNPLLIDVVSRGVALGCYEHVSICTSGSARYIFDIGNGVVNYDWNVGDHNVDHGFGYLPKLGFRRVFRGNFTLCCVVAKPDRDWTKQHRFFIATETMPLPGDVEFIHAAIGGFSVAGVQYASGQTAFLPGSGADLVLPQGGAAVVCTAPKTGG